jgi:hypothetical protein
LIGGGPTPTAATWMEAQADARRLHIAVRGLDGATRHEVTLAPLA